MAYSEALAGRIRGVLERSAHVSEIVEKKMFGGIAFMLAGNMCVGVIGDELMVRCGPDAYDTLLAGPHTREFDFTGRPMRGWLVIEPAGVKTKRQLQTWVARGEAFAASLPPK